MHSQRKRQHSLKQLPTLKKSQSNPFASPKVLPAISQQRQAKKNSTKDLTLIISRFINSNQKQGLLYSEELLRNAVAVIKAFSQVQNNFQDLFAQTYTVIKRFTFSLDDPEIYQLLKKYNVKTGFSFRKTCMQLENQLDNVMRDKNNKISDLEKNYNQIKKQYQTQVTAWKNEKTHLELQVERYRKLADVEYVKNLQQRVQSMKVTILELQNQITKLARQNDELNREVDQKDNLIHDQQYEIAKLKADLYDARDRVDKNDIYFNKMRDRFDGLLVKMMGLKEVIAKVEQQNNTLVSERMKMVNRAAVAFEDLTPRPKYKEFVGFGHTLNSSSTNQIMTQLSVNPENRKIILEGLKQKSRNQKMQQAESVREKVVQDIILAKKEANDLQKRQSF